MDRRRRRAVECSGAGATGLAHEGWPASVRERRSSAFRSWARSRLHRLVRRPRPGALPRGYPAGSALHGRTPPVSRWTHVGLCGGRLIRRVANLAEADGLARLTPHPGHGEGLTAILVSRSQECRVRCEWKAPKGLGRRRRRGDACGRWGRGEAMDHGVPRAGFCWTAVGGLADRDSCGGRCRATCQPPRSDSRRPESCVAPIPSDGRHFIYMAYRLLRGQVTPAIMLGKLGSFEAEELGPCTSDVDFVRPNRVLYTTGSSLVVQTLDIGRGALTGDPVPVAEGLPPDTPYPLQRRRKLAGRHERVRDHERAGVAGSRRPPAESRGRAESLPGYRPVTRCALRGSGDCGPRHGIGRRVGARSRTRHLDAPDVRSNARKPARYGRPTERASSTPRIGRVGATSPTPSRHREPDPKTRSASATSGNEGPMCVVERRQVARDHFVDRERPGTGTSSIRDVEGKQPPRRFCASPSSKFAPMLSPDGRCWLSYSSDETGRQEVDVRSFPDGLRKRRVSSNGGSASAWSKNGRELIYQNPTKRSDRRSGGAGCRLSTGQAGPADSTQT